MSSNPSRKSFLKRLLGDNLPWQKTAEDPRRGRLLLETLEKRAMLAGDADLLFTDGEDQQQVPADLSSEVSNSGIFQTSTVAEGEDLPDLVQFAKDLSGAGVKFFGAAWSLESTQQKQLFEDGSQHLPFTEVTNPDRTLNNVGVAENISIYPTWEFPDGTRATGVQSLQTLSERSQVAIPQGVSPSFKTVGNQTVRIGSPLHLPIDAYSPAGEPLTVSISVADPSLLEASTLNGNRSIRIDLEGYNDMVFELFEQRAETASGRVIQLANSDFYDGIIFHRVVDNFVIQGGDPTGTGTSGSNLGNFDDDYHPELQHNREGVLSFAKSSDDTNNSQFFVTETPTRFLDFNHSVFGQLVEGFEVREAISETAVNGSSRPLNDVTITTIDVFDDTENSVIMFKPTGNGTGTTAVTVTVSDQTGRSTSETFDVSVSLDSENSQPYLDDLPSSVTSSINTTAQLQLTSIDIEGDPVIYFAQSLSSSVNGSVEVDSNSGLVTVTPTNGFVGTITAQVGVAPGIGVIGNGASDSDTQRVSFVFEADTLPAPTSLDLSSNSDSGTSSTDNITNSGALSFLVQGVVNGATVNVVDINSASIIGTGTAVGSTAIITTNNIAALGDGTYQLSANQNLGGVISPNSGLLTLQYDSTAPSSVIGSASTQANVGRAYETDLISSEEGSGLIYGVTSGPDGLSIDASTGVITWTPLANQLGDQNVEISLTDLAGNVRTETLTINVGEAPTAEVRLELTDLEGNLIDSLSVGESFLMKMIAVDARAFSQPGIYGAYADILFDEELVEVEPGTEIVFADGFGVIQKGTFLPGQIDELGAVSSSIAASNVAESHIATVRFKAKASGTMNFRSEPADDANSEFLMFGIDTQIPASAISYGSTPLTIGQSFSVTDDTVTLAEDSSTTVIDVLSNDQILGGSGSLTVISVSQPASGGTSSLESGVVSYTPNANFNGTSTFTYRVSDTQGIQQTATVTVTVESVNDPPSGGDDSITVDQNSGNNFLNVLANDTSDPDTGETLKVARIQPNGTTSAGATISIAPDGAGIFYQPETGFSGIDTFTYTVTDGSAEDQVNVTVNVLNPDNPPTAVEDSFTVVEDDTEASFDLLSNDLPDVDGQDFIIETVSAPDSGGGVRISPDGLDFFYQPAPNFNGTENFTYVIRDSGGGSSTGSVSFTVSAVNDPPPAIDLDLNRNRGGSNQTVLSVAELPVNPDSGETLTLSVTTPTEAGGSAEVETLTQTILYTPAEGFVGTDLINYTVSDGSDLSSSGTITIEVTDYQPRQIQVTLPKPISDLKISGITLTGTDASGNSVERVAAEGLAHPEFNDLLPGDYTIRIPAIPFFQNAETPREIAVNSGIEDGDTVIDSAIGRLRPEFISIRDWLRSTPKNSVLVAIEPGQSSLLISESSEAGLESPEVSLDGSGALLTIQQVATTTDEEGGTTSELVQATVDMSDPSVSQPRGAVAALQLYRIATDSLSFSPVPAATGQGEGEFIEEAALPFSSNLEAEGESLEKLAVSGKKTPASSSILTAAQSDPLITGDAITVADLFVPVTDTRNENSNNLVMQRGEGELWVADVRKVASANSSNRGSSHEVQIQMDDSQADPTTASNLIDQLAYEQFEGQENLASAIDEAFRSNL